MGPTGQDLLPPLARAEEREEDGFRKFKPLKSLFSSPVERGKNEDEDKASSKANEDLRRENLVPVPISSYWQVWRCGPSKVKLTIQK